MNVWKSIFTAELRRERVFFGIFLLMEAAVCVISVRQSSSFLEVTGSPTTSMFPVMLMPPLILLLVGVHVFRSAWQDSPTRRASHLSFRPVRYRVVGSAKLAAWLLLFALPAALFESYTVHRYGFPDRTVMLGGIQSGIVMALTILTGFWIGWMWESRAKVTVGLALMMAAFIHIGYLMNTRGLSEYPLLHDGVRALAFKVVWFAVMAVMALVVVFLKPGRPRGWVRLAAGPVMLYLALLIAAGMCLLLPKPQRHTIAPYATRDSLPPGAVVTAGATRGVSNNGLPILALAPPAPASLRPDESLQWDITGLSVNGLHMENYRSSELTGRSTATAPDTYPSQAGYNALVRHLGDHISINRGIFPDRVLTAEGGIPQPADRAELAGISARLKGTVSRWTVAKDRPLLPSEEGGRIVENFHYRLWIVPQDLAELWTNLRNIHLLYSPTNGHLVQLSPRGGMTSFSMSVQWLTPDDYRMGSPPFRGYRLITLRPEIVRYVETSWTAPSTLPVGADGNTSYDSLFGPEARKAFDTWMADNPVPGADSTPSVMSAWLRGFLPRIPMDDEGMPYPKDTLRAVAASHPVEVLEVLNGMVNNDFSARLAFSQTLPKSLLRSAIFRHGNIRTGEPHTPPQPGDDEQAAVLGPYAAMKVRRGQCRDVLEILLSAPGAVDLTHAEWLDVFRLYPSARSYNALREMGVPMAALEKETAPLLDVLFPLARNGNIPPQGGATPESAGHFVQASVTAGDDWNISRSITRGSVPDVELALASGHPEAVEWYGRCYQSLLKGREIHLPSFSAAGSTDFGDATESLRRYFVVPEDIPAKGAARQITWFLSHPPEDFTFDPEIRKFRLK